ncbi:uncharacterized protein MONOS_17322 [Monocercomonoides exilis]|uniref:uncharacterized protein n=1 Tax=Monocercomonoides exilis TaxID=2049356 RepID=UPI003559AB09|nr:hypothetical protein MONOS_17322 [Monocercomonoides exilis]
MLSGKKKMRLFDKQRTIGYINKHLREILQFPEETPLIIVIGSFAPSPSSTLEQLQAFYTTPDSKEAQKGYFGVLNLDYYDNASFG